MRFLEVGQAEKLEVSSQNASAPTQRKKKTSQTPKNSLPPIPQDQGCQNLSKMHLRAPRGRRNLKIPGGRTLQARTGQRGEKGLPDRYCFSSRARLALRPPLLPNRTEPASPRCGGKLPCSLRVGIRRAPRHPPFLPAGLHVSPSLHTAEADADRANGEGSRCPAHEGAPC